MTDRRLAALEDALSPTARVVRWMAEAHAHGSAESYVAAMLAQPVPPAPLDRLAQEAIHGARASMKGRQRELVAAAVRRALRETIFRFELVLGINIAAHELLDREALIDAALSAHLGLLVCQEQATRRKSATYLERLAGHRDLAAFRLNELRASEQARAIVQEHYLDGHGALFPDVAAAWEKQVRITEEIADVAEGLAELDGVPDPEPADPEALPARTAELVADLVEPAKSSALEMVGECPRAFGIATGWLRMKLASMAVSVGSQGTTPTNEASPVGSVDGA
jgi:hypothetical protein